MELGAFRFDPDGPSLSREGRKVEVPSRALEVLRVLSETPGRVVDKRVIFERVWPDGFVEENNLWQQIHLLRKALAADPQVRVETVPRRGYRLAIAQNAPPRRAWGAWIAAAAATVLVAIAFGYALVHRGATHLRGDALADYRRGLYHLARREPADLAAARTYLDRTVAEDPASPAGFGARAILDMVLAQRTTDSKRAAALYRASAADEAEAFRRGTDAYAFLARAAREAGDPALRAASADDYRQALALAPADPNVASWFGFSRLVAGAPADAERLEARASQADPSAPIPLKLEGVSAYYAHDYAPAAAAFRNALAVNPSDDESLYYLGLVELARAHPDAARRDFDAAIALHRTLETDARLAGAYLDAGAGHPERARAALAVLVRPEGGFRREAVDAAALWMALGQPARAAAVLAAVDPRDGLTRTAVRFDPRLASLPFRPSGPN